MLFIRKRFAASIVKWLLKSDLLECQQREPKIWHSKNIYMLYFVCKCVVICRVSKCHLIHSIWHTFDDKILLKLASELLTTGHSMEWMNIFMSSGQKIVFWHTKQIFIWYILKSIFKQMNMIGINIFIFLTFQIDFATEIKFLYSNLYRIIL